MLYLQGRGSQAQKNPKPSWNCSHASLLRSSAAEILRLFLSVLWFLSGSGWSVGLPRPMDREDETRRKGCPGSLSRWVVGGKHPYAPEVVYDLCGPGVTPLFSGGLTSGARGLRRRRDLKPQYVETALLTGDVSRWPVQTITLPQTGPQCPPNGWKWKNRHL